MAPFYYYPGWWEGGPQLSVYCNTAKWNELPADYKAIVETACADANSSMLGKYDAQNPAALRRLIAAGTQLRPFSREVMAACYKASQELYEETSAKNAKFKKVYDSWKVFREDQFQWFRVSENTYDNFAFTASQTTAAPTAAAQPAAPAPASTAARTPAAAQEKMDWTTPGIAAVAGVAVGFVGGRATGASKKS